MAADLNKDLFIIFAIGPTGIDKSTLKCKEDSQWKYGICILSVVFVCLGDFWINWHFQL